MNNRDASLVFVLTWTNCKLSMLIELFALKSPRGHCRCDMLIVCIQKKKFNWKIFVLFWTACNFIIIVAHIFFFYCQTNVHRSMCVCVSLLFFSLSNAWLIRFENNLAKQFQMNSILKIAIDYRERERHTCLFFTLSCEKNLYQSCRSCSISSS